MVGNLGWDRNTRMDDVVPRIVNAIRLPESTCLWTGLWTRIGSEKENEVVQAGGWRGCVYACVPHIQM